MCTKVNKKTKKKKKKHVRVCKRVLFYIVCDHSFYNYDQQVSSAGRVLNINYFYFVCVGKKVMEKELDTQYNDFYGSSIYTYTVLI